MNAIVREVQNELNTIKELPTFKSGDTISVHYSIKEGNKERIQVFQGVVLKKRTVLVRRSQLKNQ